MKAHAVPRSSRKSGSGFSLIELLVVISIIAILAALLLPALNAARQRAQVTRAKQQIADISTALQAYETEYNRMPLGTSLSTNNFDTTLGCILRTPTATIPIPVFLASSVVASNSFLIPILMAIDTGAANTPNPGNARNPKRTAFLQATKVTGPQPGVAEDWVYRDPWGNPYILSLDLDSNGRTKDSFYCRSAVSDVSGRTGLNGLINASGAVDDFQHSGPFMIWSAGPDGLVNPAVKANTGANKDNVLSWK